MALDFFMDGSEKPVFSLDDHRLTLLSELLLHYAYRTGVGIDRYCSEKLGPENFKTLVQVIDEYKISADLNRNREKAAAILGMAGLLQYGIDRGINLCYEGD